MITISGRDKSGSTCFGRRSSRTATALTASGEFEERRQLQAVSWMRDMLNDRIMTSVYSDPRVAARLPVSKPDVREGRLLPTLAVYEMMTLAGIRALEQLDRACFGHIASDHPAFTGFETLPGRRQQCHEPI